MTFNTFPPNSSVPPSQNGYDFLPFFTIGTYATSKNSVRIAPGSIIATLILNGANSRRNASLQPSNACFVAMYHAANGKYVLPTRSLISVWRSPHTYRISLDTSSCTKWVIAIRWSILFDLNIYLLSRQSQSVVYLVCWHGHWWQIVIAIHL